MEVSIIKAENLKPKPDETQLGFGKIYTDHMFNMDYHPDRGWHDPRIEPYGPLVLDPATIAVPVALDPATATASLAQVVTYTVTLDLPAPPGGQDGTVLVVPLLAVYGREEQWMLADTRYIVDLEELEVLCKGGGIDLEVFAW